MSYFKVTFPIITIVRVNLTGSYSPLPWYPQPPGMVVRMALKVLLASIFKFTKFLQWISHCLRKWPLNVNVWDYSEGPMWWDSKEWQLKFKSTSKNTEFHHRREIRILVALFCKLGNSFNSSVRKVNVAGRKEKGIEPRSLLFFSWQISELKILLTNEIVNVSHLFL